MDFVPPEISLGDKVLSEPPGDVAAAGIHNFAPPSMTSQISGIQTSSSPVNVEFQSLPPNSAPSPLAQTEPLSPQSQTTRIHGDKTSANHINVNVQSSPTDFVPSLGAWAKRISIIPEPDLTPQSQTLGAPSLQKNNKGIPPPALKEDGQYRFPWAAKMNPKLRNLHRVTSPSYLEDGTPMVDIPNHVLLQGLENQKEYIIGQFFRCKTPSGGLVHAVANRIWGKKGKIFTRKLGESSFLFHIPDASTRAWVLQRGLWHVDECLLFVAPWTPEATLAMPEITSVPVWVTLKNIPSRLYSHVGFSWVASGLGEPVLTEKPRLDPTLMGEAKLLVEVELDKGFPHRIAARDKKGIVSLVDVEYSWIPSKCDRCGKLGHKESRCLDEIANINITTGIDTIVTSVDASTANIVVSTDPQATPSKSTTSPIVLAPAIDTLDTSIAAQGAITPTRVSTCVEATPVTPIAAQGAITPTRVSTCAEATPVTPTAPQGAITPTRVSTCVEANPVSPPTFELFQTNSSSPSVEPPTLILTDYSSYEIGDFSAKSRGGRPIRPTQKVQENNWTLVGRRGKRGRGGRGGH